MGTKNFNVIDMHCDTIKALFDKEGTQLAKNTLDISIEGMQKGDYLLQFFAIFLALLEHDDPYKTLLQIIDFYDNQLAINPDTIAPVLQFSDIAKNQADKKISALLTIEDSGMLNYVLPPHIEKSSDILNITLERLNEVYNRGVRPYDDFVELSAKK